MVPDLCTFNVDIRLTPALDDTAAATLLRATAASADAAWPGTPPTDIEITTRWPPYALPDGSPLRGALLDAAARVGLAPAAKVAGPSNIGNYLAGLGIPATAGFGVASTRACTAPTSASAWTRYRSSRPPTTRHCSACCSQPDLPRRHYHQQRGSKQTAASRQRMRWRRPHSQVMVAVPASTAATRTTG